MYSHNLLLERTQRAVVDGIAIYVAVLASVWIRHSSGWLFEPTATPCIACVALSAVEEPLPEKTGKYPNCKEDMEIISLPTF